MTTQKSLKLEMEIQVLRGCTKQRGPARTSADQRGPVKFRIKQIFSIPNYVFMTPPMIFQPFFQIFIKFFFSNFLFFIFFNFFFEKSKKSKISKKSKKIKQIKESSIFKFLLWYLCSWNWNVLAQTSADLVKKTSNSNSFYFYHIL